jgi:hypothetical protein
MPRCKYKIRLNPPPNFQAHEEAIIAAIEATDLVAPVRNIDISYGFGPSAEVRFDLVAPERDWSADLVKLAEVLRTAETRAEVLAVELLLTAAERDDAEEEPGRLDAYDAPYRQARGE